ncbi:DUF2809 domain-containing protein [Robertmurraya kyonggiensis]|uniref:DUF2809 domain-containing protein n=1 Tax=Robertmurraya kyonggiensis TaxID=1037680 RepID=A0A4U1D985_9BACI|nr:DUF2809 domain-containing protein [Robertmurraya kyonggiensis]TKC19051.1 DUF2809 domain-containing protein [Robertmurraya kyonggiensis]
MNTKRRYVYFVAIVFVIILGLASRKYGELLLPTFLAEHAGDALWAMMVYFGFRFLFVQKGILTAVMLSILFSFSIEFSQMYRADWINQLRNTIIGALILGKGFLLVDLVRYTLGIMFGTILDKLFKQLR